VHPRNATRQRLPLRHRRKADGWVFRDGCGWWLELLCCTSSCTTRGSNGLAVVEIIWVWSAAHDAIEPRYRLEYRQHLVPSIWRRACRRSVHPRSHSGNGHWLHHYLGQRFQRHVHTAPINTATPPRFPNNAPPQSMTRNQEILAAIKRQSP
jgi:hypothetical protein